MFIRRSFYLLTILLVCEACSNSSATIDLQNAKGVTKGLSNKWETEYMESAGSRIKVPESQISHILFYKNGTYTTGVKDGLIKQTGEWSYDSNSQMLNMGKGTRKSSSRILKLTGKQFAISQYTIFNDVIMDSIVMTYRKL